MEYTPLATGAAVGVGMGIVDRGHVAHEQLLYRGGGLLASLVAQHQGWGPPNFAPAAVTAFATHFAARAFGLAIVGELGKFGAVYSGPPNVQHLTGITEAGMRAHAAACPCGQVH